MGRGLNGPTGLYVVQRVGLVHSSERGGVSFPSELHVDKTALVLLMNKETAVIVLAQVSQHIELLYEGHLECF